MFLEMMKHYRTIQERSATFCVSGTVSVNDYDLDLHLEVGVCSHFEIFVNSILLAELIQRK